MRCAFDRAHRLGSRFGFVLAGLTGAIALVCHALPAKAHPHVWATVRSEVELSPKGEVTAIRHTWTFDQFYSAMALQGLDTNHDGVFSRQELQPLADINVKSLKDFKYFTFVTVNQKKIALSEPVDYWVTAQAGIVTLHFTLPLPQPVSAVGQKVQIDVYDPTFFVAFGFAKTDPVTLGKDAPKTCGVSISVPDANSAAASKALTEAFFTQLGPNSNYGAQFAQTAYVSCKPS